MSHHNPIAGHATREKKIMLITGEKLNGLRNTGKIEIVFDDVSTAYYAFWYPPQAIGSGKTELDALRDMQEAIHFAVDTMIESRCEGLQNVNKESHQIENR
jgi:hypothetical protein